MEPHLTAMQCVTCHMGSHTVTCHPTQVNMLRRNPSCTGWYSIYLLRSDGRLSWPKLISCRVRRCLNYQIIIKLLSPFLGKFNEILRAKYHNRSLLTWNRRSFTTYRSCHPIFELFKPVCGHSMLRIPHPSQTARQPIPLHRITAA